MVKDKGGSNSSVDAFIVRAQLALLLTTTLVEGSNPSRPTTFLAVAKQVESNTRWVVSSVDSL